MVKPPINNKTTFSFSKPSLSNTLANSSQMKGESTVQKGIKNIKAGANDKLPVQTITLSDIEYFVPQKKFKDNSEEIDNTESLETGGEDEYTEPEYLEEEYLSNEDAEYTEPEYLEEEGLNNDDDDEYKPDIESLDEEYADNDDIGNTDAAYLHEGDFNDNTSTSSDGDYETIGSDDDILEFYYNKDSSTVNKTVLTKQTSSTRPRPSGLLKVHKDKKDSTLIIEEKQINEIKNNSTIDLLKSAASKKTFEKSSDFPTPSNLNQYGDCLKTRLGRYHYGLTITDPPCQFFQGVIKGPSGESLSVMFADINLFSKFEKIPKDDLGHFVIDTTFRVLPNSTVGVNHVLTINLIFQNETIPLWYAIASVSSSELFKRIIIEFLQHVLDWPFKSVLLNNDPVLCKAVRAVFPDIKIYGSWFYYCYGIWKEIRVQGLLEQVRTDATLLTGVKLLMVLPYLPPIASQFVSISMLEGFETVKQYALENNLPNEFFKVLNYVAIFWFNKVKSCNFTLFGKVDNSVVNLVELFQLSLLSYLKSDGTVWTLNNSFQSVAKSANTQFDRYLNGKPLVRKKNRGRKCIVQVRDNTKKLIAGSCDVKTFLEKSTVFCDELLDIFLHPLYPTTSSEKSNYVHVEDWKIDNINNE